MNTPRMTEQEWAEHQRRVRISKSKTGVRSGVGTERVPSPKYGANRSTFFVPGRLPGANDIMSRHRMVYARLKVQWGTTIAGSIRAASLKPVGYCRIEFVWHEANNRRDDDNVTFAKKFILDALRATKIIKDDRRKFIHSVTDRVIVDPARPGVEVTIISVCVEAT